MANRDPLRSVTCRTCGGYGTETTLDPGEHPEADARVCTRCAGRGYVPACVKNPRAPWWAAL